MRYTTLTLSLALAVTLVSGCAGGGDPYRPTQLAASEAAIYIYRRGSVVSPGKVGVYVDQQPLGELGKRQHLVAIVAPGEHFVRVQRRSDATRRVRLAPGETAFLEASVSLFGGAVSLTRPADEIAMERIARTRAPADPARIGPDARRD